MNMNDVVVQVNISLNGATITPTAGQQAEIRTHVLKTVFQANKGMEIAKNIIKAGRKTRRRRHIKELWTPEHIEVAEGLRAEGKTNRRIAGILNHMFGTHRTDKAVQLMFWNHKNPKPTGPKVKVSMIDTVSEQTKADLDDFNL